MGTVNIMDELINKVQEYNEKSFDLKDSIEESKAILENEMYRNDLSDCQFEQEKWFLENVLEAKKLSIDFNRIREVIQFNQEMNTEQFIDIVKCWTASLIDEGYSALVVEVMINSGLRQFMTLTKGLTSINEEEFVDEFNNFSERRKRTICTSALNFLDYYSGYSSANDEFVSLLYSVKPSWEEHRRLLPPSKDILIFSKVLQDYFSKELSEQEYLRWFPVWLWWNLTSLIPMRPSEYCTIERNCLIPKDGGFYIKLPRHKQKQNKRKIQILDTIKIPEHLYRKIEEYRERSDRYGKTDTLISYRSIPSIVHEKLSSKNIYVNQRINPNKFTINIFRFLLNSFYEYIVFGEYKVSFSDKEDSDNDRLSITRKLRSGDTRHLAFINLHRQGYHATEIARLGGHVSIYTQGHYFNHVQKSVDLEILDLIQSFDLDRYSEKISEKESKQEHSISISFIEQFILRPPKTDFRRKMKDGYCTFEEQKCPVEDCWECTEWWRISEEEFSEKQHILAQKLNDSKSDIEAVIENLQNLYKGIYKFGKDDFFSSDNSAIRKELINKSKRIDNAIRKYVSLIKVKERIVGSGDKR
ncbi:MAG: hypothetical protein LPK26_17155 [Bacillaceae bacterium]|nr:hypothetical protein [Bacillaceae bacterium]